LSATKPRERTPRAGAAAAATSDASAPELPREFAPNVYLLSAGAGPLRANVYFVRAGASWALVDTGVRGCAPQICAAAEALFGAGSRPAALLITHSHPDHVGSAAELARAWGCPAYLHPDELPLVSGDLAAFRQNTFPLDRRLILPLLRLGGRKRVEAIASRDGLRESARALEMGDTPRASALPSGAAAVTRGDRGSVPGLPGWQAVPTPGHTIGHVAFFRPADRVLLSGDAVVTKPGPLASLVGKKPSPTLSPWYFTWDRAAARQAAAALAELEPLVIAGGHGQPLSGDDLSGQLRKLAAGG
jgi:glyoxylase-like metal-dependent hydrolase (beta-lactamase superfamily II)